MVGVSGSREIGFCTTCASTAVASEKDLLPVHHYARAYSHLSLGLRLVCGMQQNVVRRRIRASPTLALTLALAQDSHLIGAGKGVCDEPVLDRELSDQDPGDLRGGG